MGAGAEHFDELEIAVIRFGRATAADGEVAAEEWDAAVAHLDDKQMVQLVLTICWYVNGVLMMKILALDLENSYKERRPTI